MMPRKARLKYKYHNEMLKLTYDSERWKGVHKITGSYLDEQENVQRYRMCGLWFNEHELEIITIEENPEYFL